ncbi:MAG: arginine--tRNA ligase, partial [Kiritimatiellae bacterium]|nr:arginine--tRNA ligase [Kiritimatiellia bacterium]
MLKMKTIEQELADAVQVSLGNAFPEVESVGDFTASVVKTSDARHGDYQCNDCMQLAKMFRLAPRAIAEKLMVDLQKLPALESVEVAGPGFLNFRLSQAWLEERLRLVEADTFRGTPQVGEGATVVLDYSSPNVAKPMHIGHIRSTVIGNALDRLHRFCGYRVIADNHLGDWGTQFGLILLGYRHFADQEALEASPVQELERVYVKSYQKS